MKVHHWRYETGIPVKTEVMSAVQAALHERGLDNTVPQGWYCWMYANDDQEFRDWMAISCPRADVAYRFNSGDPMHTVHITDSKEALLFQLRWL